MISSFTGNDEANDGNEIGPDETRQLREDVARLQVLSSTYMLLLKNYKLKLKNSNKLLKLWQDESI